MVMSETTGTDWAISSTVSMPKDTLALWRDS